MTRVQSRIPRWCIPARGSTRRSAPWSEGGRIHRRLRPLLRDQCAHRASPDVTLDSMASTSTVGVVVKGGGWSNASRSRARILDSRARESDDRSPTRPARPSREDGCRRGPTFVTRTSGSGSKRNHGAGTWTATVPQGEAAARRVRRRPHAARSRTLTRIPPAPGARDADAIYEVGGGTRARRRRNRDILGGLRRQRRAPRHRLAPASAIPQRRALKR